ncbi:MAG TPA: preprotein translocase subunit SecA [Gammaproteobacteria bacterium]|nr:preprotein translocase subunit SecA [Gammaproteobacteria bacterium]HRA42211.1 preprotein translocase subunit SecA [Gammaproteobacteria bacterium]
MFITKLVRKTFGSRNERLLKRYRRVVESINALEPRMIALSDSELRDKTTEFKDRIQAGVSLEQILPEAFAVVREASKRTLKMRHFDVQLVGGIVLHEGKIAEMRTGEGKTLVATLPLYLNALVGKGTHLVTANDYLAKRDAEWNQPIYEFLGLSVGVIIHGLNREQRQAAYAADITYGTNNEFGFDYLRDNMVFASSERVQRGTHYAVVDEVDSILIDEARTPLIISGADQESSELYEHIDRLIPMLDRQKEKDGTGDYSVDEKSRQAFLTEDGHVKVEKLLLKEGLLKAGESLYDAANITVIHHLYAGLKAHALFKRDVDYIVRDDQVIIVDEHTGRVMPGRRWSEGIHQAVEAKERVKIESENQTLASITFQNYFRLYQKLAGMTGTADTEAYEFQQIYGLEVVVIPTNRSIQRKDMGDFIYLTQKEKFEAIIEDIASCVVRKQPVLVGTISIETSEYLSGLLKQKNIVHQVLNAKQHEREAEIITEAGRPGTVTIATNMAGRGTDIVLGGKLAADASADEKQAWQIRHDDVIKAGGLHIIGTERHESRRIDNQLRGRSARQGDPGSTRFYLSLKDNLMRIFISDNVSGLLSKLGLKDGEVLTHPWVSRAVENAQRKVEGHNFDVRKQLLEFDDVANDQRKVIYHQRNDLLEVLDVKEIVVAIREDVVNAVVLEYIPPESFEEQWDISGLEQTLERDFGLKLGISGWLEADRNLHEALLKERILLEFITVYDAKEAQVGSEAMRHLEKSVMLSVLDTQWREHLAAMDYMRQSIHLRGYAQKDPKQEYKREAFALFTDMLESIKRETIGLLMRVEFRSESDINAIDQQRREHEPQNLQFTHADASLVTDPVPAVNTAEEGRVQPYTRQDAKIGRNDACPCGSGKKYKACHGRLV